MISPASPKATVRIGVIGLGLMGERHCRVIKELPGASLAAVCDHNYDLAKQVSTTHGVKTHKDSESLLADSEIDAVVLCLPSSLHAEIGIAAARAGKHVIVEKPIDSRSAQGRRLVDACNLSKVHCAIIHQNRYSPGLAALKLAISTGMMGTPVLARASVKWFRHDAYYTDSNWRGRQTGEHGGVLMNQAIHSIDTLQWLFGIPARVSGYCHLSRPGVLETEDTAAAVMQWESGMIATLEASTAAAPGFDEGYEVHSTTASARIEKGKMTYWYHQEGLPAPEPGLQPCPSGLDDKLCLFYRQYLDVLNAIQSDVLDNSTALDAVAVVETVERIYRSANEGISFEPAH